MQNVLLENWLCNLTSILGFVLYIGQIRIAYMLVLLCILIHTRIDINRMDINILKIFNKLI